ncbi:hypothetical protein D9M71_672250 [compost metagenome]
MARAPSAFCTSVLAIETSMSPTALSWRNCFFASRFCLAIASSATATLLRASASLQLNRASTADLATCSPKVAFSSPSVPFIWLERVVSSSAASSTRMVEAVSGGGSSA